MIEINGHDRKDEVDGKDLFIEFQFINIKYLYKIYL